MAKTKSTRSPAGAAVKKKPVARASADKEVTKTVSKKSKGSVKKAAPAAVAVVAAPAKPSSGKLQQNSNHKGRKKITSAAVLKGYNKVVQGDGESNAPLSDAQLRKVKTELTRSDLNHYRELLLQKRAEILGDVQSLQLDVKNESGTGISYEHMADAGSDNFEQEFTLGLMETERKLLELINDALLRIKKGTYGVCVERGTPINKARLDAKPWAKWCIEVAREKEKFGEVL